MIVESGSGHGDIEVFLGSQTEIALKHSLTTAYTRVGTYKQDRLTEILPANGFKAIGTMNIRRTAITQTKEKQNTRFKLQLCQFPH